MDITENGVGNGAGIIHIGASQHNPRMIPIQKRTQVNFSICFVLYKINTIIQIAIPDKLTKI